MKRIFAKSAPPPEAGAVYRNLQGSCFSAVPVRVVTPPGCSAWPVRDNNYGALPTSFPPDTEIASSAYDGRFSSLSSWMSSSMGAYIDLWDKLSSEQQSTVLPTGCYCMGQGMAVSGLTIGRPQFPYVTPLPFFWLPPALSSRRVRQLNPNAPPLPGDCCPNNAEDVEYIDAEVVDGQLRLTSHKKADLDRIYRTTDANESFQAQAGYPRWCCIRNDCGNGYVLRWLHFLRWPRKDLGYEHHWDPYYVNDPQEPLGIIPRVVDIQCDPAAGVLYVYYANDVIHDGHFADLQWDVDEPRATPGGFGYDPASAPDNPQDLTYNEDYQGNPIYDPFAPVGSLCEDTCSAAAALINLASEICQPTCPICSEFNSGYDDYFDFTGSGSTQEEAEADAMNQAEHSTPGSCDEPIILHCYTLEVTENNWESHVRVCCKK